MTVFSEIVAPNGDVLVLNPDARIVGNIVKMCVTRTGGYCPCDPAVDADHVCPCKKAREEAHCCCHLYIPKSNAE